MTTKYGVFSEPPYLSPGITYRKDGKAQKITEFAAPNIKATIPRIGKVIPHSSPHASDEGFEGNDATFDKFKPLFEKDPYQLKTK